MWLNESSGNKLEWHSGNIDKYAVVRIYRNIPIKIERLQWRQGFYIGSIFRVNISIFRKASLKEFHIIQSRNQDKFSLADLRIACMKWTLLATWERTVINSPWNLPKTLNIYECLGRIVFLLHGSMFALTSQI